MSNPSASLPDSIVTRIREGDIRAFEQLYMTYVTRLWQFAYRYVQDYEMAEDIVQDVFRTVWERRTLLEIRDGVEVYLYGAVRNRAMDMLRRAARTQPLPDGEPDRHTGDVALPPLPDEALLREDVAEAIQSFLDQLPQPVGHILYLRWQHTMSYDDIARALGLSPAQARQQVHRVLQRVGGKLRRLIGE